MIGTPVFAAVALLAFTGCYVALCAFRPVAYAINLTDAPGALKHHVGQVPLVGGLSILSGYVLGLLLYPGWVVANGVFLSAGALLVLVGTLDDRFVLSPGLRLVAQFVIALIGALGAGLVVDNIGAPFFTGVIELGWLAVPFTVLVFVGGINAWNMIDGIDGLASMLAFIGFVFLLAVAGPAAMALQASLLTLICAIGAFFLFNMPLDDVRRQRTFLGDAGSMFLGLAIVWHSLALSQGEAAVISPVIALWFVAMPVYDLICTTLRRMAHGRSPLAGDRQHLHHLLKDRGLSNAQTLLVISVLAVLGGLVGLVGHKTGVSDGLMFSMFAAAGVAYYFQIQRLVNASLVSGRPQPDVLFVGDSPPGPDSEPDRKIIFFANTDWYLFNFRLGLARFLRDKGAEVVFMSPPGEYGPKIEAAGFRWLVLPMDRRSLNVFHELVLLKNIVRIYRAEKPDVVHNFTIKCVVYGSLAAQVAGIRKRVNAVAGLGHIFITDSVRAKLLKSLVKMLFRIALTGPQSQLILQNPDDQKLFRRLGLIGTGRTHLIKGSGVDTGRFTPSSRERGKPFRILLASRLLWEKGIGEYVGSARLLQERADEMDFLLAGATDSGNPSAVPEADIAQWDREGLVKVLGHLDNMSAMMHKVDLVVLPSYYGEGVPRGLIEAAAMGLPIITTDAPGCREIVEDGVNGFLVPVRDEKALADRIEYLLDNPEVCRRFGTAGRQIAVHEFDEQIVFEQTWAIYQQNLSVPRQSSQLTSYGSA